jgi:hypothetical protein
MTVVKDITLAVGVGATVIGPGIFWVTIITKFSLFTKLLWKVLAALSIDHARSVFVLRTARTMHHALCDSFVEHGMSLRIRNLS